MTTRRWRRILQVILPLSFLVLVSRVVAVDAPAYDPLATMTALAPETLALTVHDADRNRDIPIRVYLPSGTMPAPTVLFSHGLGGTRDGCSYLGHHWSARGYVGVFLQHPGSDDAVWKDKRPGARMAAMRDAAGAENFNLRRRDVAAVLDQLTQWNETKEHPLFGRFDLTKVGMSGHSFGAVTTQAISGQRFGVIGVSFADPRIKAAIALSPSSPRDGGSPARAFGRVHIPWLLMTGTHDIAPIGGADVASRLAVFPALPPGSKYELLLNGAAHSAFTDHTLPRADAPRNPNHHRVILALTTAFWDSYLRDDPAAKAWLDGDGPRSVLAKEDRWQRK